MCASATIARSLEKAVWFGKLLLSGFSSEVQELQSFSWNLIKSVLNHLVLKWLMWLRHTNFSGLWGGTVTNTVSSHYGLSNTMNQFVCTTVHKLNLQLLWMQSSVIFNTKGLTPPPPPSCLVNIHWLACKLQRCNSTHRATVPSTLQNVSKNWRPLRTMGLWLIKEGEKQTVTLLTPYIQKYLLLAQEYNCRGVVSGTLSTGHPGYWNSLFRKWLRNMLSFFLFYLCIIIRAQQTLISNIALFANSIDSKQFETRKNIWIKK